MAPRNHKAYSLKDIQEQESQWPILSILFHILEKSIKKVKD